MHSVLSVAEASALFVVYLLTTSAGLLLIAGMWLIVNTLKLITDSVTYVFRRVFRRLPRLAKYSTVECAWTRID